MPYKSASMHWTISGWDFSRKPKNFICLGPSMDPAMALQYTQHCPLAIFLHSMQQKWDQGNLGTQRSTLIGSRARLGLSMDPAMALQHTWHGPLYIGYLFAFYATKMGSRDSGDTNVDPHWVQDPPWSFNGPCHGPTIHTTWPFIYWLYFCILCNKTGIKELWGDKVNPHWV